MAAQKGLVQKKRQLAAMRQLAAIRQLAAKRKLANVPHELANVVPKQMEPSAKDHKKRISTKPPQQP